MSKIKVVFYTAPDGSEPVRQFLDGLNDKIRAKTVRTISLLRDNGTELREPVSKHLGDGIFELRAQIGNNTSRVLYFFCVGNKVVLTNGFIKKTQKTPLRELERAKRYRSDYLQKEDVDND